MIAALLAAAVVVVTAFADPQLNHLVGREGAILLSILPAVVIGTLTGLAVFALALLAQFVRRHRRSRGQHAEGGR